MQALTVVAAGRVILWHSQPQPFPAGDLLPAQHNTIVHHCNLLDWPPLQTVRQQASGSAHRLSLSQWSERRLGSYLVASDLSISPSGCH